MTDPSPASNFSEDAAPIQPDWRWATPEGSRELDRRLDRQLTFREKLDWLEEAETLALRLQASREARTTGSANEPTPSPPTGG